MPEGESLINQTTWDQLGNVMKLVGEYGFLVFFAVVMLLCVIWIGHTLSKFLLNQWQSREVRIDYLETQIVATGNGIRASLEQRLDASTEAQRSMADAIMVSQASLSGAIDKMTLVIAKCPGAKEEPA